MLPTSVLGQLFTTQLHFNLALVECDFLIIEIMAGIFQPASSLLTLAASRTPIHHLGTDIISAY